MTHTRPRGRRLGQLLSLLFCVSISTVVFGAHEIPNESCNDDTDTHTDRDTQHTMLLQKRHQLMLKAAEQSPQVDSSLSGLLPIEWVHVRKSGSSFMYALFHTKGACPNMPKEAEMYFPDPKFWAKLEEWKCNASVVDLDRLWHHGIEYTPPGGFNSAKGRFMMMMRQPEQRILSEYNFQKQIAADFNHSHKAKTLQDIVAETRGAVTQMLTTSLKDPGMKKVSDDFLRTQLVEAKLRLRTGFSFIGLTEQWILSICLFNTMFNQTCYAKQFENTRATNGPLTNQLSSANHYDTAQLNGWRDPYDNELYDIAGEIFKHNLKLYNVSESSCEPCWSEAGLL